MVGVCFAITAQRKGEHWNLSADEKTAWGDALANVLKYVPMPEREAGIAMNVVALGFVAFATVAPRMDVDKQLKAASIPTVPRPVAPVPEVRTEPAPFEQTPPPVSDPLEIG